MENPFEPTQEDLLPEAIADRVVNWITELPKHPKANGMLIKTTGYCCLGVAAKLAEIPDEEIGSRPTKCYTSVQKLFGLSTSVGGFSVGYPVGEANSLVSVNDRTYASDTDHTRTSAFIRANIDLIWDEPLATLIKERLEKPNTDGPIQTDTGGPVA